MKKLFSVLLALVCCGALCACEKTVTAPPCADVAAALTASQTAAELTALGEKQIAKYLYLEADQYAEASVSIDASRATAECICVLTAKDKAGLETITQALHDYRADMIAQYSGYRPEEVPKLEAAKVQTKGLQAVLCVLPDAAAAEKALNDSWK